jgi:putative spermidine/putrescine transport system substrate-binding protein
MDVPDAHGGDNALVTNGLSRRELLHRGLGLGVSMGALGALSAPARAFAGLSATKTLTVLDWGGPYADALNRYVSKPFSAATHAKVTLEEQAHAFDSLAKIQAQKSHPSIDVWFTTGALPLLLAKSGGLAPLDPTSIPNLSGIFPFAIQKYQGKIYGAGIHLGAESILVDNQAIKSLIPDYNKNMLRSWKFLYRPELKDNIAIAGFDSGYGTFMIGASKPYGGSENNEEAFFAAMKQLAPNVHTVPAGSSYVPLFLSKEIVASMGTPVDAQQLIQGGASVDVGYPLDPLVIFLDYVVVIKNGPAGPTLPQQFTNQLLDPKVMTNYDGTLGFNAPNSKSVQPVLKGFPSLATRTILRYGWIINYDTAIKNFDAWNQRFQQEIVPLFGG